MYELDSDHDMKFILIIVHFFLSNSKDILHLNVNMRVYILVFQIEK